MEKYDYFKCEICGKYKPTGCELVRKLAYSKWIPEAQNEAKKEARLSAFYVLICSGCETKLQSDSADITSKE